MSALHETQKIAAVVLFKDLHSKQVDVYDVLAAFIKEIIVDKGLIKFTAVDMGKYLIDEYGFDSIPQSVIKNGIKRTGLTSKREGYYIVDHEKITNKSGEISTSLEEEIAKNDDIISGVCSYIEKKQNKTLSEKEKIEVTKSFCAFLLDSKIEDEYIAEITSYIVSLDGTPAQARIDEITEGVYQYAALTYNDDISKIEKLRNEVTIFMDTEALLSLGGFHGEIHRQYIDELLLLISEINEKNKRKYITVRYMDYVKNEIYDVFHAANYYVMGMNNYSTDAAESIADGCKSVEDIIIKRINFYAYLKSKGILEYSFVNRYSETNSQYNLEGDPNLNSFLSEEMTSKDIEKCAKRVSDINKLRNGCLYRNFEDIKFVFMSDNGKAQTISNYYSKQKGCYAFVLSSSRLTNILWLKMNKGLSKTALPSSLKAMTRSRVVLSSLASTKMKREIDIVKSKIQSGELENEALYEILTEFKSYAKHPEDVTVESVDLNLKYIESGMKAYGEELSLYKNEAEVAKLKTENAYNALALYDSLVRKRDELLNEKKENEDHLKSLCKKMKYGKYIYRALKFIGLIICFLLVYLITKLNLDDEMNSWIANHIWYFEILSFIICIICLLIFEQKLDYKSLLDASAPKRLYLWICKMLNVSSEEVDKYTFLISVNEAELLDIETQMENCRSISSD